MKNVITQTLIIWGAIASYGLLANEALKGNLGTQAKTVAQNIANGFGV